MFEDVVQAGGGRIETFSETLSHNTGGCALRLQEIIFRLNSVTCFAYRMAITDADACRDYVWITDHRLTASAAVITLSVAQGLALDVPAGA